MEKIKNILILKGLKAWQKMIVYYFVLSLVLTLSIDTPIWFRFVETLNLIAAWYLLTTYVTTEMEEEDDDDDD